MLPPRPHIWLDFREPRLDVHPPQCLILAAACLACGWRMPVDNEGNIQNSYIGPEHMADWKRWPKHKTQWIISFRFLSLRHIVEGETFRVEQFVEQVNADTGLYNAALKHPKFQNFYGQLCAQIGKHPPKLGALERNTDGTVRRIQILPVAPPDTPWMREHWPQIVRKFTNAYEGG